MTTVQLEKTSIERKEYENFLKKFKEGEFGGQRLGQAFYNHFNLHKVTDQASLCNLYEKDSNEAKSLIRKLFDFT